MTTFERTFVVKVPVERVWKAMTDPAELNKWYFPMRVNPDGSTQTEVLGEQRTSEIVAVEPLRKLHTRTVMTGREVWGAQSGTRDMIVVFASIETGTRVTITNSGFGAGDDWDRELANLMRGQGETISDLVLYLETGVAFPRHNHGEKSWIGFAGSEAAAGLRVASVQPGTFAHRLGLQPGDYLVELGGASVFGIAEVQFFTKEHAAGEEASAAWVRDGQLLRGSAELGPRLPVDSAVGA